MTGREPFPSPAFSCRRRLSVSCQTYTDTDCSLVVGSLARETRWLVAQMVRIEKFTSGHLVGICVLVNEALFTVALELRVWCVCVCVRVCV